MNRRHKRYASVLGLAVAAFMVDRLFLAGPESASAAADATAPSSAPTGAVASSEGAAPRPVLPSLEASMAGRLETVAAAHGIRGDAAADAFEQPASWHAEPAPVAVRGPDFASRHVLQAALANGAESLAIVDGRTVRLGQVFDGLRLVEVQARAAIFEGDEGRRVELPLAADR